MFNILIVDNLEKVGIERLAQSPHIQYTAKGVLTAAELRELIPEYDALITRSGTAIDQALIQHGRNLKVIGRAGVTIDNIDLEAATRQGIIVMNTPQANSIASAEQTLALMLGVSRFTAQSHASLLAGEWDRSKFIGTELAGKTLGIVGFGRVGRLVAKRAQAFDMHVIAYDPYVSETIGRNLDVTLVDADDLFAQADYITLHSVLNKETESIINHEAITQMKEGVVIINAARGQLIDELALAEGLKSGKVGAAALDVYAVDPPENNPLVGLPNVLHTPHLGSSTKEAQHNVAVQIVEQVLDALQGTDYRNALNVPFRAGPDFAATRPYMLVAEKIGILQQALALAPITKVELEVSGDGLAEMVRPVAAALLHGLLQNQFDHVNTINAPLLAKESGLTITQAYDLESGGYTNLISCRVHWHGGQRLISGVLFGGREPRIVQIDEYHLEANPIGTLLFMRNKDVPGVIGQVATLLATYNVNIAEWRLGRTGPGGEALSLVNLDGQPPQAVLDAIAQAAAVTDVRLVTL